MKTTPKKKLPDCTNTSRNEFHNKFYKIQFDRLGFGVDEICVANIKCNYSHLFLLDILRRNQCIEGYTYTELEEEPETYIDLTETGLWL